MESQQQRNVLPTTTKTKLAPIGSRPNVPQTDIIPRRSCTPQNIDAKIFLSDNTFPETELTKQKKLQSSSFDPFKTIDLTYVTSKSAPSVFKSEQSIMCEKPPSSISEELEIVRYFHNLIQPSPQSISINMDELERARMEDDKLSDVCRFCRKDAEEENLIIACYCRSDEKVHRSCLQRYMRTSNVRSCIFCRSDYRNIIIMSEDSLCNFLLKIIFDLRLLIILLVIGAVVLPIIYIYSKKQSQKL